MPLKNDVKFTSSALDSDSDEESDVGSGVTLGFVDGVLSVAKEMKENSYCNKIGGFPTFSPTLTNVPDTSSSSCGVCNRSMPLIAQLFCPLSTEQVEGSGTGRELWHRLIYIWACVYKDCQRKEGSVRAFRALRRVQPSKKGKEKETVPSNPFSFASSADASSDLGSSIFGSSSSKDVSNPFSALSLSAEAPEESEDSPEASDDDTAAGNVRWDTSDSPRLPAQYLATSEEPSSLPLNAGGFQTVSSRRSSSSSTTQEKGWQGEQYEHQHLSGLDSVYLKFQDTVMVRSGGELSDQVLRYERAGAPLPFCMDESYGKLFPNKKYDSSKMDKCKCGSKRVFEVQLLPQIVSYLSKDGLLRDKEDEMEITWSAVWVFCCERDCGIEEGKDEAFLEEKIMLQYE